MARLIPALPDRATGSERRVLDKLQRELGNDWIVLHSVGLRQHETKRWAEADCVLIGPKGIFVLEIKGGSVRCEDGVWRIGEGEREYRKTESPWEQAMGALASVERQLAHADARFRRTLTGFGVVLPDVEFDVRSATIEPKVLLDRRSFREPIGRFMDRLSSHWRERTPGNGHWRDLTTDDIRRAREILRPDVLRLASLDSRLADAEERLIELTREQIRAADRMASNPRTLVLGGAGTGKTLIAINRARALARQGRRVLFLCFNQLLAAHLRRIFQSDPDLARVDLHHLHGLYQQEIERASQWTMMQANTGSDAFFDNDMPRQFQEAALATGMPPWDALIVDEAQDILTESHLDALDWMLGDAGLARGRWHLFMDDRQDIYRRADAQRALERLHAAHPASEELRVNCRNTRPIAEFVSRMTGLGANAAPEADGPVPEVRFYRDADDARTQLDQCVGVLVKQGIAASDIVVLSTRRRERSLLADVAVLGGLPVVDVRSSGAEGLQFSTMQGFKGLERRVVLAIDMDEIGEEKWAAVHYVGLSRAKGVLWVFLPVAARGRYEGLARQMAETATRAAEPAILTTL